MRMINICTHPIHGRCFLWEKTSVDYAIGTIATNYMNFDGWTLDKVIEKITDKGFKILKWDTSEEFRP